MAWNNKNFAYNTTKYAVDNLEDWVFFKKQKLPNPLTLNEEKFIKEQFRKELEQKYNKDSKFSIRRSQKLLRDSIYQAVDLFKYLKDEEAGIINREQVQDNLVKDLTKNFERNRDLKANKSADKIVNVSLVEKNVNNEKNNANMTLTNSLPFINSSLRTYSHGKIKDENYRNYDDHSYETDLTDNKSYYNYNPESFPAKNSFILNSKLQEIENNAHNNGVIISTTTQANQKSYLMRENKVSKGFRRQQAMDLLMPLYQPVLDDKKYGGKTNNRPYCKYMDSWYDNLKKLEASDKLFGHNREKSQAYSSKDLFLESFIPKSKDQEKQEQQILKKVNDIADDIDESSIKYSSSMLHHHSHNESNITDNDRIEFQNIDEKNLRTFPKNVRGHTKNANSIKLETINTSNKNLFTEEHELTGDIKLRDFNSKYKYKSNSITDIMKSPNLNLTGVINAKSDKKQSILQKKQKRLVKTTSVPKACANMMGINESNKIESDLSIGNQSKIWNRQKKIDEINREKAQIYAKSEVMGSEMKDFIQKQLMPEPKTVLSYQIYDDRNVHGVNIEKASQQTDNTFIRRQSQIRQSEILAKRASHAKPISYNNIKMLGSNSKKSFFIPYASKNGN